MLGKGKLTIKVPGKLMVAGEFAVLVPYHHLAVTAVDRFVYAAIEDSPERRLSLEDFGLYHLSWHFDNDELVISSDDKRISFVQEAMRITCTYLKEQGIPIDEFHLSIRSELNDQSGVKYGLGSSAAVVSAVVTAIYARFFNGKLDKDVIFKLAALAHVRTQGNGSGADIAASVYGGVLRYSSFQAEWLLKQYEKAASISELLAVNWKYLSIKPLELPQTVQFCVGWTGSPASTVKLVDMILKLKETNPNAFEQFLQNSERAVHIFFQGMEESSSDLIFQGIKANRQALRDVGIQANAPIETPLLTTLCDLADEFGGAGKPSGAGGGDCGIAFIPGTERAAGLFDIWEKAGVKPLDIKSHPKGAVIE